MYGNVWKQVEMCGNAWKWGEMRGNEGKCLEMPGNVWKCKEMQGIHQESWNSMEFHGILEVQGVHQWISHRIQGFQESHAIYMDFSLFQAA